MKRIRRDREEMLRKLSDQLHLLRDFALRLYRDKVPRYAPEVANKLRLLLWRGKSRGGNKPLLLDIAKDLGIKLTNTLPGPAGFQLFPWDPPAGVPIPAEEFLVLNRVIIDTSEGQQRFSTLDLIKGMAEQEGGAHLDPTVSESLRNALRTPIKLDGFSLMETYLGDITGLVLDDWGDRVIREGVASLQTPPVTSTGPDVTGTGGIAQQPR